VLRGAARTIEVALGLAADIAFLEGVPAHGRKQELDVGGHDAHGSLRNKREGGGVAAARQLGTAPCAL